MVLEPAVLYVFHARLDTPPLPQEILAGFLSPSERARAARFRFEKDRRRFSLAAGWLRWILGGIEDRDRSALSFELGRHGKPRLPDGPPFNLSRSADRVFLAVAAEGRVGADIEVVRPVSNVGGIAQRYFSPEEVRELSGFPIGERERAFFRAWTRKEAFTKALGRGLSLPLDSFSVSLGAEPDQALRWAELGPEDAGGWEIHSVPVGPDAEAAVAWDRTPHRILQVPNPLST